jgi:hypothetical protein
MESFHVLAYINSCPKYAPPKRIWAKGECEILISYWLSKLKVFINKNTKNEMRVKYQVFI